MSGTAIKQSFLRHTYNKLKFTYILFSKRFFLNINQKKGLTLIYIVKQNQSCSVLHEHITPNFIAVKQTVKIKGLHHGMNCEHAKM